MNVDDESFLSAYLDGELDAHELQAVESALMSDPALSARLHSLSSVHELLAGLPRPSSSHDLSGEIVQRIGGRRPAHFTLIGGRVLSRTRVRAAGLATAATVLFTLSLAVLSEHSRRHRPLQLASVPVIPESPQQAHDSVRVAHGDANEAAVTVAQSPRRQRSARNQARTFAPVKDDVRFRDMLDDPNLRKMFIVLDKIGGEADERVSRMIESSPRLRSRFGRITIAPEIVVDPKHPNKATVFVVAVDDQELDRLRNDLQTTFVGAIEELDPDPAVVTQLADLGAPAILPGTSATPVELPANSPRHALRQKEETRTDDDEPSEPSEAPVVTKERTNSAPLHFQDRIARAPSDDGDDDLLAGSNRNGASDKKKYNVVLVWVTTRR